ncbi:MAG: chromosome segregation protein SMC [Candidatus Contendobacter sp.]|nr:chromosome segregation protein SMC [Candidatus Contendobacter sp.]MDS4057683.1 chromosome segregation protein SMC [Candidatus Contendobacter sp.]
MRLSTIKLAGFKSFVDPTVLHLPSELVGIVGPNGCGKSNIIDAVRWVMGESSARSLRGETMSDVIFNGSASRKPVGQASIELVFDNRLGRLGGPWANYGEIAIRRVVSRDGQSSYFLNGARCRRRDIADIFLGTGLGPRSYAIIEQGTISRVVEARPEELRVFLEEAAGISKYKERRRETEARIQHARDNLGRLDDMREELERQLRHLQRQARAAEQYRELRAAERRLRAELLTLRWRSLGVEIQARDAELREREVALEAVVAEQRRLEARLETTRARRLESSDRFNEIQGRYYQTGADISRLEQFLRHQRDLRRRREDDERQMDTALAQVEAQWDADRRQRDELTAVLAAAEPEQARALANEADASAALIAAEIALREGQAAWEEFGRRQAEARRQAEVERTWIEQGERQWLQGERRLERLRFDLAQLAEIEFEGELLDLRAAEQGAAEALCMAQERLADVETAVAATEDARRQTGQWAREARDRLQIGHGRLAALRALQEAAFGRHDGGLEQWLRGQDLIEAPRLAERLEVEPGWEKAVETALAGWLDAVCVADLDGPAGAVSKLDRGRLTLLESPPLDRSPSVTEAAALAVRVRTSWPLAGLLDGVRVATSLAEALANRAELRAGETWVTPDGVLCGRHWLRLARGGDDGVLAREREIRCLEAALAEDAAALEQWEVELERLRERQRDLEQQRREAQRVINQGHRDHAAAQGRLSAALARAEQACARRVALAREITELEGQGEQERERIELARARLEEAASILESLGAEQEELDARRERLRVELHDRRDRAEVARQDVSRWTVTLATARARLVAAEQALARLAAQRGQLLTRREELATERAAATDVGLAAAEAELAAGLERRVALEAELGDARQRLEAQDAELQADEQARGRCERQAETLRRALEERRLAASEMRIRQQTLLDQVRELASEPEAILSTLPAAVAESDWLARLEQVERRIERLGAVNLAAIEEFAQVSERKRYLDAQNADLLEALATLENAMRKIDRETRARFRETFERVNVGLGELFPRLFGGGQAHLDLTGEDALDTGVTIMAKPPGKRIGSISLLSGGEKALTAIALVFAIFQLNPAPFCLLDEVDAPLDEANVGRFGALVREMAERVQFIFVTHNKATMEIARHLAGVTMQEPGVSRLVAVDVEEAARWATLA